MIAKVGFYLRPSFVKIACFAILFVNSIYSFKKTIYFQYSEGVTGGLTYQLAWGYPLKFRTETMPTEAVSYGYVNLILDIMFWYLAASIILYITKSVLSLGKKSLSVKEAKQDNIASK